MKLKIISTKDVIVGAFMQPFYQHNEQEALRNWSYSLNMAKNNPQTAVGIKDLQLWQLGEFDDETGEIRPNLKYLGKSVDYLEVQNEQILQREQQTSDNTNPEE